MALLGLKPQVCVLWKVPTFLDKNPCFGNMFLTVNTCNKDSLTVTCNEDGKDR